MLPIFSSKVSEIIDAAGIPPERRRRIEGGMDFLWARHSIIVESLLSNGYVLGEILLRESNPKYRFGNGPRADVYVELSEETDESSEVFLVCVFRLGRKYVRIEFVL